MLLELKDYALREDIFGFRNGLVKKLDASAVVSLGFGVGNSGTQGVSMSEFICVNRTAERTAMSRCVKKMCAA